jgi:hypothetical protein
MSFGPTFLIRTIVFVGDTFQILDKLKYACGLKGVPAATLNQNPIFETVKQPRPEMSVLSRGL